MFQTLDETFFLFGNGSLYALQKTTDYWSDVNLKSTFIAQLWGQRNGFVGNLKPTFRFTGSLQGCETVSISGAQIINKILYVFGSSSMLELKYIHYLHDFDKGLLPEGYFEFIKNDRSCLFDEHKKLRLTTCPMDPLDSTDFEYFMDCTGHYSMPNNIPYYPVSSHLSAFHTIYIFVLLVNIFSYLLLSTGQIIVA